MQLTDTYAPRRIAFQELVEHEGWRLKLYSILFADKDVSSKLLEAAKSAAFSFLPQPATTAHHYGVGFVSVHQGKSYDFVTVAYWTYETELRHQTYMRPSSGSSTLELVTGELSTDVWDLRVLAFERDAWLENVLRAKTPDVDTYLSKHLTETL